LVSLRQTITPDRLLGRVNATYRTYIYGAVPVGSILGGLLGTLIGLRAALVVGALGLATGILWILFSPVPRLLTMPAAESLEQGLSKTASSSGVGVGNP
jgi:predicted MFS family arabinose efflux permease